MIKEGLYVDDAVEPTYKLSLLAGLAGLGLEGTPDDIPSEEFCVSLIKTLSKSKANFREVLGLGKNSNEISTMLSTKILRALLEAGADPDSTHVMFQPTLLFMLLGSSNPDPEKIKLLVEHKASLTYGIYGMRYHAMGFYLEKRKLEDSRNLTRGNFNNISAVIEILRSAGADTSDAKKYLNSLRSRYRNVPDALKYIDNIEKCIDKDSKSSFWGSLWGSDETSSNINNSNRGSISGNKVNVRTKPNTKSRVIKQLNAGHPVEIIEEHKSSGEVWYHIKTASGTEGWVSGRYVELK